MTVIIDNRTVKNEKDFCNVSNDDYFYYSAFRKDFFQYEPLCIVTIDNEETFSIRIDNATKFIKTIMDSKIDNTWKFEDDDGELFNLEDIKLIVFDDMKLIG